MNLAETVVGAVPFLVGALFVYFAVRNKSAPTDSWSRFFRYSESQKRINFLVVGLIAVLIGFFLMLDGLRLR